MPHIQSQSEWEEGMGEKILDFIHHELYMELRFLNVALSALKPKSAGSLQTLATDGVFLYYPAGWMISVFQNNQKFLNRAFLHSVLHCIFSHLWIAGNRDQKLWHTACDIIVEYTIDQMRTNCTSRILSWQRQQCYHDLEQKNSFISAAVIYRSLQSLPEDKFRCLQREFYTDDHSYWPVETQKNARTQTIRNQWAKIARQTSIRQTQQGSDTSDGGALFATQLSIHKSRRSYRDFLKKFTMLHEELQCNPDEFDLNYYTYGLKLYGNLPFIEPLETREIQKIREFVIVIDTSDSTRGDLVKNFLKETFRILDHQEHFFSSCKIRLLQCDDQVRMDQEINSLDQSGQLLDSFTLLGGGGTDFRPAFSYVNQLVEQKKFRQLGGLLYFTDGRGIYPKKRPPYQTAFLFYNDYDDSLVPPWAICLRLEPEQLMHQNNQNYRQRGIYEY